MPFQHLLWHESQTLIVTLLQVEFLSARQWPWHAVNGCHFLGVLSLS